MWQGIRELGSILLLWRFWYLGSFMLMIVAIFYFIQSNQPPIIKQYHTYNKVQVVEPPKRVLVEREVCNMISGCAVVNGTFVLRAYWKRFGSENITDILPILPPPKCCFYCPFLSSRFAI